MLIRLDTPDALWPRLPEMDVSGRGAYLDGTFSELPGIVFDTETTGVEPDRDRVVELGAICVTRGALTAERRMRINPERPIPASASAIHGIYDADVRDKPVFAAVAERFIAYLNGGALGDVNVGGGVAWLAAYNAGGFDVPLLNAELVRAGLPPSLQSQRILDPMIFVRWHLRHLRSRSLENVCKHYGIPLNNAHSALGDARATALLLLRMVSEGLIPADIETALAEQAQHRALIAEEWEQWSYWLYRDRQDGRLRLGAGSFCGQYLGEVSGDYLRSLASKVSDLPERVRATFLEPGPSPS